MADMKARGLVSNSDHVRKLAAFQHRAHTRVPPTVPPDEARIREQTPGEAGLNPQRPEDFHGGGGVERNPQLGAEHTHTHTNTHTHTHTQLFPLPRCCRHHVAVSRI